MPSTSPLASMTRLNASVKELCVYLYDLTPLDLDIFFILKKEKKPMTLEELSN
jgi:predicted transcriptional regulator